MLWKAFILGRVAIKCNRKLLAFYNPERSATEDNYQSFNRSVFDKPLRILDKEEENGSFVDINLFSWFDAWQKYLHRFMGDGNKTR